MPDCRARWRRKELAALAEDLLLEATDQTAGTDTEEAVVQPFLSENRLDEAIVLHRFFGRTDTAAELYPTQLTVLLTVLTQYRAEDVGGTQVCPRELLPRRSLEEIRPREESQDARTTNELRLTQCSRL